MVACLDTWTIDEQPDVLLFWHAEEKHCMMVGAVPLS